jgi:TatD DNase family protein
MLIDAHAHVDRYGDALPAALQEIEQHQIFTISNSMGLESYQRNLEIAASCPWVLPIFGVHPWNAVECATRLEDFREAMAARDQGKVVHLHTKGAETEVLDLLVQYGIQRMIVHWYSGPLHTLRELLAIRAYFTVGIEVLYSEHIRAIARELPLERLLTETDNPGGPRSLIGRLGTPLLIQGVVGGLADLRKTSAAAIEQAVQANLARLVRDDARLPGA